MIVVVRHEVGCRRSFGDGEQGRNSRDAGVADDAYNELLSYRAVCH